MVGCAAFGCTNRSEKGFIMKKFPKDAVRRKIWAANVKRKGWFPTDCSVLCEVHFEASMWEKTREDGSRKLIRNAVPTLFSFIQKRVNQKSRKQGKVQRKHVINH